MADSQAQMRKAAPSSLVQGDRFIFHLTAGYNSCLVCSVVTGCSGNNLK